MIEIFTNNYFNGANSYAIYDNDKEMLLVDVTVPVPQILYYIKQRKIEKVIIAYTHNHLDHILYGRDLYNALWQCGIACHSLAAKNEEKYYTTHQQEYINHTIQIFRLTSDVSSIKIPQIDYFLSDGEAIGFKDFIVYSTPGHSEGSCCFYSAQKGILVTGDTIFAGGSFGRTDFPGSSYDQLRHSIKRMMQLPPETKIYPGHGIESSIKFEQNYYEML